MEVLKNAPSRSSRLHKGNVVLANAQKVNTKALKARLNAFADVHRSFLEAQTEVEVAETAERGELKRIEEIDGELEKAITALSAALLLNGEPRRNAFGRFSDYGPGQMVVLPFAEKVRAAYALAANLRRNMGSSPAIITAAEQLEKAAHAVEAALPNWELRRTYLNVAREGRDSLNVRWDTAYTALRLLTQSVVEDPNLYAVLFARPRRPKKTRASRDTGTGSEPPPTAAPAPVPEQTPRQDPQAA